MDNLTLISCSYNTPEVTENMLKTFTKYNPNYNILICENSTDDLTLSLLGNNNIPYIRNYSGLHGPSVDLLLNSITTDYALLVDTDVLFLKNIDDLFEAFKGMDLAMMGEIVGDRGGKRLHKRVNPWFCFINVKQIKENGIKFYDEVRMKERGFVRYDVGSSFFQDIHSKKLKIGDFNGSGVYYRHFEGMSWRTKKFDASKVGGDIDNVLDATHDDVGLYQYGMMVESAYSQQTKHLKQEKINYVCKH
jgi:hypothetical protein